LVSRKPFASSWADQEISDSIVTWIPNFLRPEVQFTLKICAAVHLDIGRLISYIIFSEAPNRDLVAGKPLA
jgi:hypothetical protein